MLNPSRIQVLPFNPDVVGLVMHELSHFQQIHPDNDLLARCMREGTADFVAELVSGHNLNARNKIYGDSHEEQLWVKFQQIKPRETSMRMIGSTITSKKTA